MDDTDPSPYLIGHSVAAGESINTPPVIDSVHLTTTNPATNDTDQNLTCYANASDLDGDNVTYYGNWFRNGIEYYQVSLLWNRTIGVNLIINIDKAPTM
jgi:hypothetical protein